MTTKVTINAHCASTTQVEIIITNSEIDLERIVLQDGESTDVYVYDDRSIQVRESEKK